MTSIGKLDNSRQLTSGCTSPCSTLSPISAVAASNATSKFQQPEASYDTDTGQKDSVDNSNDNSDKIGSKIGNSTVTEQRFCFTAY